MLHLRSHHLSVYLKIFKKKLQLSYFGQYFESNVIFKTGEKFSNVSKFGIEVLSLSQIVMVLNSNSREKTGIVLFSPAFC